MVQLGKLLKTKSEESIILTNHELFKVTYLGRQKFTDLLTAIIL